MIGSISKHSGISGIAGMVGNTPLLAIRYLYKGEQRVIYTKAESMNMTGSIKDRMAFFILSNAYARSEINNKTTIIEATSGNTGISFSAIGRALGLKVVIFMPDWMSSERVSLIRSFGADVRLVSHTEGGFLGSIKMAEEMADSIPNSFLPRQFSNTDNVMAHFNTTGPEIWQQLDIDGKSPDAFVAGVGTGGTVMGVGRYLKKQNSSITVHPLEPANSPTLTTGHKVGKHRIQGISDEFIPSIVDLEQLDNILQVDDGDAILMSQKLSAELGLGTGISCGANFLGAVMIQNQLGKKAVVVTVFPDSNKKYLSTDLLGQEPVKNGFLTPDIQLIDFRSINQTCRSCGKQTL